VVFKQLTDTAIIEQQYVSLTLQNSNTQWWII
jgi:hypothetical protein